MPLNLPTGLAGPATAQPDPGQPPPPAGTVAQQAGSFFGLEASPTGPAPFDPRTDRLTVDNVSGMKIGKTFFNDAELHGRATEQVITNFGKSHLQSSLARTKNQTKQFGKLRNRQANNVAGQSKRLRHTVGKTASLQAARQGGTPTSFAGGIQDATRRAGVRQGIVNRGEKSIANQSLKDRLSFVKGGIQRRGVAQQALSQGANIREGVNIGVTDANNAISASNSDLFGTAAGAAAGLFADPQFRDRFSGIFSRQPTPTATSTQGTLPSAGTRVA